jgi:plasmid stabilization system protein ParE
MAFQIEILPAALVDAEEALGWWKEEAPAKAPEWYHGLLNAIASLEEFPSRCPVAHDESNALGLEIRKLLYGKGQQVYRVYFRITAEGIVRVLRIRHTSRDRIEPDGLAE